MAGRVDLDAAERQAQRFHKDGWVGPTVLALVAELRVARREREALRSALERTRDNFVAAVRGLPVRDMAETLAEADASLAYDPAAGHADPEGPP